MSEKIQFVLDRIREERMFNKIGQKEIAALLDVDDRTYNKIENGKSSITLNQLFVIADFFKKDITHFVSNQKNNHIENSSQSGVFYDNSSQTNHSDDAINAYKLLTDKLFQEIEQLKSKS